MAQQEALNAQSTQELAARQWVWTKEVSKDGERYYRIENGVKIYQDSELRAD